MTRKTLGVMLLIAAFTVLLSEPAGGSIEKILHLFLFLGLLVTGGLSLMGLIGVPPEITALRRDSTAPARYAIPSPPTDSDEFSRPQRSPTINLFFLILSVLMLCLAGWAINAAPFPWFETLLITLPLLLSSIGYPIYYHCHYRTRLLTTPTSLILETCRLRRELAWSDVIMITSNDIRVTSYMSVGSIHTVYAQHGKIRFTGRIERLDQLTSTIARATGLSWMTTGHPGDTEK